MTRKMSSKFTDSYPTVLTSLLPTIPIPTHCWVQPTSFIPWYVAYRSTSCHAALVPVRTPHLPTSHHITLTTTGCWRCAVPFLPQPRKMRVKALGYLPQGTLPQGLGVEYQWARSFNAPKQQIVWSSVIPAFNTTFLRGVVAPLFRMLLHGYAKRFGTCQLKQHPPPAYTHIATLTAHLHLYHNTYLQPIFMSPLKRVNPSVWKCVR